MIIKNNHYRVSRYYKFDSKKKKKKDTINSNHIVCI